VVRTNGRRSPRSAGFRPLIRSGKRILRLGMLAEEGSLAANILFAPLRFSRRWSSVSSCWKIRPPVAQNLLADAADQAFCENGSGLRVGAFHDASGSMEFSLAERARVATRASSPVRLHEAVRNDDSAAPGAAWLGACGGTTGARSSAACRRPAASRRTRPGYGNRRDTVLGRPNRCGPR
jgi:hypothetical protein